MMRLWHARLGGIAEVLARRIESETIYDARSVNIGHSATRRRALHRLIELWA